MHALMVITTEKWYNATNKHITSLYNPFRLSSYAFPPNLVPTRLVSSLAIGSTASVSGIFCIHWCSMSIFIVITKLRDMPDALCNKKFQKQKNKKDMLNWKTHRVICFPMIQKQLSQSKGWRNNMAYVHYIGRNTVGKNSVTYFKWTKFKLAC